MNERARSEQLSEEPGTQGAHSEREQRSTIVVEDAPAIAACLQFWTDAHALKLAGRKNDAARLAGILLNLRDHPALLGFAQSLITPDQFAIEARRQLCSLLAQLLQTQLQLRPARGPAGGGLLPRLLCLAHYLLFLRNALAQALRRLHDLQRHLLLARLLRPQVLHLLLESV